ncbi:Riboflavin biosynthesis protein RibD [Kluyvera cryocrescens]|uniref:Riboflavin biosynthesis protein RibD n=1 Tax=Kluyvera cryocrescens TaxID=580 RepID=A0A485CZ23_KLUCR|nr:Riboflavin biosynthesis protein RibD [Kluyvera cryocrescens]
MHDEMYMARALKLAQRGRFTTHPNPARWLRDCKSGRNCR